LRHHHSKKVPRKMASPALGAADWIRTGIAPFGAPPRGATICQSTPKRTSRNAAITRRWVTEKSRRLERGAQARPTIGGRVSDRGWKRTFDKPIQPRDGGELVTLQGAGNYIAKLPKAEHEAAEWQAARHALILVAENGGRQNRRNARVEPPPRSRVQFGPEATSLGKAEAQEGRTMTLRQSELTLIIPFNCR
jgi:hypothetical protein